MKIKELLKGDKKGRIGIYILLLLGVALLAFGSAPKEKEDTAPQREETVSAEDYMSVLEERLESILSSIEGAGRVEVMLVAEDSGSISVGRDGSGENSKTVVLNKQSGGSEALVLAENTPELRGVLVVAEGGGSDLVRAELAEAAATVLGVGIHRVKVYKMK